MVSFFLISSLLTSGFLLTIGSLWYFGLLKAYSSLSPIGFSCVSWLARILVFSATIARLFYLVFLSITARSDALVSFPNIARFHAVVFFLQVAHFHTASSPNMFFFVTRLFSF